MGTTSHNRLLQVCDGLKSEGYRVTGSLTTNESDIVALKHPNGNRMTLIAHDNEIAYIKNGKLVKSEPICVNT